MNPEETESCLLGQVMKPTASDLKVCFEGTGSAPHDSRGPRPQSQNAKSSGWSGISADDKLFVFTSHILAYGRSPVSIYSVHFNTQNREFLTLLPFSFAVFCSCLLCAIWSGNGTQAAVRPWWMLPRSTVAYVCVPARVRAQDPVAGEGRSACDEGGVLWNEKGS